MWPDLAPRFMQSFPGRPQHPAAWLAWQTIILESRSRLHLGSGSVLLLCSARLGGGCRSRVRRISARLRQRAAQLRILLLQCSALKVSDMHTFTSWAGPHFHTSGFKAQAMSSANVKTHKLTRMQLREVRPHESLPRKRAR